MGPTLSEGAGSFIEHGSLGDDNTVTHELALLRGEIERVSSLQSQVIRHLDGEDGTMEDDELASFEEDAPSNIAPGVRSMIMEEFDQVIDKNDHVDDQLLEVLLERLWAIDSEHDKRALIAQLSARPPAMQQHTHHAESRPFVVASPAVVPAGQLEAWLASECAVDVASVERAISILQQRAHDLCSRVMPFTLFNSALLSRLLGVVFECVAEHRINLLLDVSLETALRDLLWSRDRQPVAEHLDTLLTAVGDMLYDEMLYANLVAKLSAQHDRVVRTLRQQVRTAEARLASLDMAQAAQQRALLAERRVRLGLRDEGVRFAEAGEDDEQQQQQQQQGVHADEDERVEQALRLSMRDDASFSGPPHSRSWISSPPHGGPVALDSFHSPTTEQRSFADDASLDGDDDDHAATRTAVHVSSPLLSGYGDRLERSSPQRNRSSAVDRVNASLLRSAEALFP